MEELTQIKKSRQLRKAYIALLSTLNAKEFDGKLVDKENTTLIVPPRSYSSASNA